MSVLAEYMIAGPIIIRTAFRSLVARDIRSPVRRDWKYDSGNSCRCAKKSLRRSYSMSREAPMMMRRIRNRNVAPDERDAQQRRGVDDELAARDAGRQVVDGELEHPRRDERHAGRDGHAGEADEELPPVAEEVGQEATERRTHLLKVSHGVAAPARRAVPAGV